MKNNIEAYNTKELCYLYSLIWDYNVDNNTDGSALLHIFSKALLASCFKWRIFTDMYEDKSILCLLVEPFENTPLLINDESDLKKIIYKWRLSLGR